MEATHPDTVGDPAARREQALRDVVRLLARQAAAEWVRERRRLQEESTCR